MRKGYYRIFVLLLSLLFLNGCDIDELLYDKPAQETGSIEDIQLTPTPIVDGFGRVTAEALLEGLDRSVKEYGTAGFYMNLELTEHGTEVQDESEPGAPEGMAVEMEGFIATNPSTAYVTCRVSAEAGGEIVNEQLIENYVLVQGDGSVTGYLYDAGSDSWIAYEAEEFADLSEQVSLVDFSAFSDGRMMDSVELAVTDTSYVVSGTMNIMSFCGVADMGTDMIPVSEAIPGFEDIKIYLRYVFDRETRQIESFQAITDEKEVQVADATVSFGMSMAVDLAITPEGAYIVIPDNMINDL